MTDSRVFGRSGNEGAVALDIAASAGVVADMVMVEGNVVVDEAAAKLSVKSSAPRLLMKIAHPQFLRAPTV